MTSIEQIMLLLSLEWAERAPWLRRFATGV